MAWFYVKDSKEREKEEFKEKLAKNEVMAFTWKIGWHLSDLWYKSRLRIWDNIDGTCGL